MQHLHRESGEEPRLPMQRPQAHHIKDHSMKKITLGAIALAITVLSSNGAMAENMSKQDYQAGKNKIAAEYKSARSACSVLSGTPNDICVIEARGKEKVASAELDAAFKPTRKAFYEARLAKAEAVYALAKQHCREMAIANDVDICVKEAKAEKIIAKADAKAQLKTSDANDVANEKSAEARSEARVKAADARKDAASDKRDAQYEVAKEKCSVLMEGAKEHCMNQAKTNFVN